MANKKNTRREAGSGSIRQRKDGTWEARDRKSTRLNSSH